MVQIFSKKDVIPTIGFARSAGQSKFNTHGLIIQVFHGGKRFILWEIILIAIATSILPIISIDMYELSKDKLMIFDPAPPYLNRCKRRVLALRAKGSDVEIIQDLLTNNLIITKFSYTDLLKMDDLTRDKIKLPTYSLKTAMTETAKQLRIKYPFIPNKYLAQHMGICEVTFKKYLKMSHEKSKTSVEM